MCVRWNHCVPLARHIAYQSSCWTRDVIDMCVAKCMCTAITWYTVLNIVHCLGCKVNMDNQHIMDIGPILNYMDSPVGWSIPLTDTCCDAKEWKCESVRTTYWLHTCDNGIVFWQWKPSVASSASISYSAFVYYRFKRLIVGIADIWSTGPGFDLPDCVRILTMS